MRSIFIHNILMFNRQYTRTMAVCVLFLVVLVLNACSTDTVVDSPQEGEYGTKQVASITLTPEQLEAINDDSYPKPFNQKTKDDKFMMTFMGDSDMNPYRVVIVSKGRAIFENQVNIMFAGILQKVVPEYTDRATPQIYREEDDIDYRVYQQGTFINASEPFSFNGLKETVEYQLEIQVTNKDNFNFDSIDIQLWQGLGTKQSKYSMYKLFLVIFIGAFIAYRMVFGVRK